MKKLVLLLVLLSLGSLVLAQEETEEPREFVGQPEFPAPNFPPGLDWLNISGPLRMEDLRGKIVILDFWTYGCINCIHMVPVMERIEEKYAEEVVIIGVHSAKFANEGETDNIRQIVQRYELKHPVINDHQFRVWGAYAQYGVQAWPTFVIIDPRGNLLAVQPGEIPFDAFDRVLTGMVGYFDETGELNREPLELSLEADDEANMALAFPGKVLADAATNRLFISDTNHNRVVVADLLTYEVLDVIGSGARGFNDGAAGEATFDKPQGMTLDAEKNLLYIADVNNHAVREIDLAGRAVRTIAGTGEQSRGFMQPGSALQTRLSSPWDVELGEDGTLFIAMAGPHQLWAMSLADGMIYTYAGSGREGLLDGGLLDAQLAQPSGLYYDDGMLYFADSESSSIRVVDVRSSEVHTLAGPTTNDLFAFGDVDGEVGISRLQHALGVTAGEDGTLYVADTYNSKIKVLDPEAKDIETLFGLGGLGGFRDGDAETAEFDEPGGIDYADGKLYVADTNNHAVRVIDLETSEVSTVVFPNPEVLQIEDQPTVVAGNAAAGLQITLPEQTLAEGGGEIELRITLPEGYKLNDLAPFSSEWVSSNEGIVIAEENLTQSIIEPEMPLRVPVTMHAGEDLLHGDLTIYYCEAVNESLCFIEQVSIDAPVIVGEGDSTTIVLEHAIVPPVIAGSGSF
jgi:DNA-binding beta-propeller fold protein YncE/thiol-disulfide isomerase/thioredoxin